MLEVQIASRSFFVGPGVAHFGLEICKLSGVSQVEPVPQDRRVRIAVVICNSVVHPRLRLAVGPDDSLPALFGSKSLALRDRGAALHLRGKMDSLYGTYFPEAAAANHEAGRFALL
ncbi:MAG: hypothetical protein ABI407_08955 [Bradyrhizobium sp.]